MNRFACALVPAVAAAITTSAHAFVFTLTPVTNTTPNFAGPIQIMGTVTLAAGQTCYSPNVMSSSSPPFLASFTAGFNGTGNTWDPAFLAWNGVGGYSGPVWDCLITPANLGYAGGMPMGLYASNPLGPGGNAGITLTCFDNAGDHNATATFAVNVVPGPASLGLLGLGGLLTLRRRR
jgi:uncharacterized protein (TIGR03382 family)